MSLLTKSDLVLRDLDLLRRINQTAKAVVCTTFTTFDEDLCRVLEPRVCTTRRRFETLKACREAGVRTGVWASRCGKGTGSTFTPSWTGIFPV